MAILQTTEIHLPNNLLGADAGARSGFQAQVETLTLRPSFVKPFLCTRAPAQSMAKRTKTPAMWNCPKCQRSFRITNQSHMCTSTTIEDIFAGKPDDVQLAFDDVLLAVMDWHPNTVGAAAKAIVFTNRRAWLIVRPMSKLLELSFYTDGILTGPMIHKSGPNIKSKTVFRHSIRLSGPGELSPEVVDLLRLGFDFGMR